VRTSTMAAKCVTIDYISIMGIKKSQPYGLTTGSAGGLDEPLRGIFRYRL